MIESEDPLQYLRRVRNEATQAVINHEAQCEHCKPLINADWADSGLCPRGRSLVSPWRRADIAYFENLYALENPST